MKKICLLLLPLLAAACGQGGRQASVQADEPVRVMTFNIRYDNPADSLDNWAYRKDRAAKAIRFYDADIVGTQEVLHNQLEDLRQRLPGYEVIGVGREDGTARTARRRASTVPCGIARTASPRKKAAGSG